MVEPLIRFIRVSRFILCASLAVLVSTSTKLYADPVSVGSIIQLQLSDVAGGTLERFGGGGPFRADLAGTADDFLTFCLEINEYFTPGENLRVASISDEARNGGAGGAINGADQISGTTAYMYTQFRLGDADFSSGKVLQEAFWYLENEIGSASQVVLNLIALAHTEMASIGWGKDYLGGVQVLNLYRGTNYGTRAQDMLTWNGVPEPASILLTGVGALTALAARRKRRSRSE
jgi:hypothetical protein